MSKGYFVSNPGLSGSKSDKQSDKAIPTEKTVPKPSATRKTRALKPGDTVDDLDNIPFSEGGGSNW